MTLGLIHSHVRTVQPLAQHDIGKHRNLDAVLAHPDEEIPVLGVAVRGIESTKLSKHGTPEHGRDELDPTELTEDRVARQLRHLDVFLNDPFLPAEHTTDLGMLREITGLDAQ